MTDTSTSTNTDPTTPPASGEPTGDPAGTGTTPPTGSEPAGEGPNAEAARYRVRLRETEAERDTARAHVERLQRREVERLAAEHLADPSDLWVLGTNNLAELVNDQGDVDPDKVALTAGLIVSARPGLGRNAGPRSVDYGQGARGASGPARPSWGSVFRRETGR